MGLFKEHNALIVKQAKQWLVATQDAELEALQPKFAPPAPPPSTTTATPATPATPASSP
jgi:hypothetical protein